MPAADRYGVFGSKSELAAGRVLRHEHPAPDILAGEVDEDVGGLQHGRLEARVTLALEERDQRVVCGGCRHAPPGFPGVSNDARGATRHFSGETVNASAGRRRPARENGAAEPAFRPAPWDCQWSRRWSGVSLRFLRPLPGMAASSPARLPCRSSFSPDIDEGRMRRAAPATTSATAPVAVWPISLAPDAASAPAPATASRVFLLPASTPATAIRASATSSRAIGEVTSEASMSPALRTSFGTFVPPIFFGIFADLPLDAFFLAMAAPGGFGRTKGKRRPSLAVPWPAMSRTKHPGNIVALCGALVGAAPRIRHAISSPAALARPRPRLSRFQRAPPRAGKRRARRVERLAPWSGRHPARGPLRRIPRAVAAA